MRIGAARRKPDPISFQGVSMLRLHKCACVCVYVLHVRVREITKGKLV